MDEPVIHISDKDHSWEYGRKKKATGPNILNQIVTCLYWDLTCACGDTTWMRDNDVMKR